MLAAQADAAQTGSVIAWGSQVMPLVEPGTRFTAIAAGGGHSLALKADGAIVAWGDNSAGQSMVPGDLGGVIAIAGGGNQSLALKADGTVVAWGRVLSGSIYLPESVPTGLSGVIAIVAGETHSLALKADGTVVAWGYPNDVPSGLSGVIAIAAGAYHNLALKSDRTVVAWGDNALGQSTVPSGLNGVFAIAAGYDYSVALVSSAPPTLQAQVSGNDFILSWPSWTQNFSLQATTNLADPNSWTALTDTPAIVNAQYVLTNQISGPSRFYRLKQ